MHELHGTPWRRDTAPQISAYAVGGEIPLCTPVHDPPPTATWLPPSLDAIACPMPTLDLVIPLYNEQDCLPQVHVRLSEVLEPLPHRARILFVDDGSSDRTPQICQSLAERDPRVGYIRLSRNFGHQAALTAGLDAADADAVITMDGDLQDPPEMIPDFLRAWEHGAEVVSGVRDERSQLGWLKRTTSTLFYRLLNRISPLPITPDAADFRLLDRKVVQAIRGVREQSRFLRGIYAWVGFRQAQVRYPKGVRAAGRSKYGPLRMMLFALSAVLSFSRVPLRLVTLFGLLVAGISFVYGVYVMSQQLLYHRAVPGWTSLAVLVSFLSGVQLVTLGVVGEYVGQVLEEAKARPLYLVSEQRLPQQVSSRQQSPRKLEAVE